MTDVADTLELVSHSPEETQRVGEVLGRNASSGDIILLVGELGAGKTCLTQGIARGLGVKEPARSPTFVLVSQYRGRLPLYHADLYRVNNVEEVWDLGLDDYLFGEGITVVEWAEKAPEVFPSEHLLIKLEYLGENERRLTLVSQNVRGRKLLKAVREAGIR